MDQDLVNELKRLRDERQKKFDEEDWEGALAIHDKILDLSPSALRHANRASILYRLGRVDEAVASYNKALELDPSLKRARADLEKLEVQLQKPAANKGHTGAMPNVSSLSDEDKQKKINELRNAREQRLEVQDWANGLFYHNQILDIEPNALRYANQGSILYRMGKLPEAVVSYRKALEMDNSLERARLDLEKIQSQIEEEELLGGGSKEKHMETDDQDIQAKIDELRKKRQERIDKEDWPAALTIHDELLALDPTPLRYANRASLLYRLGRMEEAVQNYAKSLQMDPSMDKTREEMERVKAEIEEAALLKPAVALPSAPQSSSSSSRPKLSPQEIAERIAQLRDERQKHIDNKDWDKALALHDEIIDLEPTPLRYVNRGSMLYRMGQLERAISDYRKALEMDQNLGRAKQDLARMEEELKQKPVPPKVEAKPAPDEAKKPDELPKKLSPDELSKKMEELRVKRQQLMEASKWEESLVVQDEILALEPSALRYANRGSILYRLGRTNDAIFSYRKALDLDSTLDRAQEDLDKIRDAEMEKLRAARQEKMDREDWHSALAIHDVILALEPSALRYANRGSILFRMGRIADAIDTYKKSLSLDPDLEQAKHDLVELEAQLKKSPAVVMAIPAELQEDEEDILAGGEPSDALEAEPVAEAEVSKPALAKGVATTPKFCVATLGGHTKEITQLAITPDQNCLVSASKDKTLRVWNLQNYKCTQTLQGHEDWVRAISLNNRGDKVISGSDDWTVKMWDVSSGKCDFTMTGHSMPVQAVAISKNDHFGFSGSRDRTIKIWDLKVGKQINSLEGHQDWVTLLRLLPEGERAISASYDGTIRIWNMLGWRCTNTLQAHQGWVEKLLVAPDGKAIISAGVDRAIRIWEMPSGKPIGTIEGHKESISDLQISFDGRMLVSVGNDPCIYLWEMPSGKQKAIFPIACRLEKLAVTPDNRFLVGADTEGKIHIWELETGKLVATWDEHTQTVCCLLFAHRSKTMLSASKDGIIKVWDYSLLGK